MWLTQLCHSAKEILCLNNMFFLLIISCGGVCGKAGVTAVLLILLFVQLNYHHSWTAPLSSPIDTTVSDLHRPLPPHAEENRGTSNCILTQPHALETGSESQCECVRVPALCSEVTRHRRTLLFGLSRSPSCTQRFKYYITHEPQLLLEKTTQWNRSTMRNYRMWSLTEREALGLAVSHRNAPWEL